MLKLLLPLLAALATSLPALAQEPQPALPPEGARIYASWHAPHGQPRATHSVQKSCRDSAVVDTLHLTFDPGRACSTFVAVTAWVWVRAVAGDSLCQPWALPRGTGLPRGIRFEFGGSPGAPFPWESPGLGHYAYLRQGRMASQLKILYAVPPGAAARVEAGRQYGMARLLVSYPGPEAFGCEQPICIEWIEAALAYSVEDEPTVSEGVRYAGLNSVATRHGCSSPTQTAPSENKKKGKTADTRR